MQNLKVEITYLSIKILMTNLLLSKLSNNICIAFYLLFFFYTYIIYKLKYIGLYIVNSDELQTNVLQTKWKVLASINMMGKKMYT